MYAAYGHLTAADLREIVRRDRSRCVYCNLNLDYGGEADSTRNSASFDHIVRLCDGGSHTFENVVCACRGCNQRNNQESTADPTRAALKRLRFFLARKPGDRANEAA